MKQSGTESRESLNLITILGPTASGKTRLASLLASRIDGEIISADSRQVYRDMNLGTGKDYDDYRVDHKSIPAHLIDIVDAGSKYNVYEFQKDFIRVFREILEHGKKPILCGGSGMYLEGILRAFRLIRVPDDPALRKKLEGKSMDELRSLLASFKQLHNVTDTSSRKRLVRAIEIETYYSENPDTEHDFPNILSQVFGIHLDRELRRKRISERLISRINEGLVEEVKNLLDAGVPATTLLYYGLEYKFITQYLLGEFTYPDMMKRLETSIHQFAKRQMTWFRGMEKRGITIQWLEGDRPMEENVREILDKLERLRFVYQC
jgi:tRNA dimethylallyltransferase